MGWGDFGHWLTGGLTTKKGQEFLFGSGDKMKKLDTMTPEQKKFLNQIISMLSGGQGGPPGLQNALGGLQDWMNPESSVYKNFEKPYLEEFEQKTIPMLGEQFAGMGGGMGGALSSSGFGQALGAAGANLQTDLAQMKSDKQRQALQDYLNAFMSLTGQTLGAQPFGYQKQQGSPGFLAQAAPMILQAAMGGM